MPKHFAVISILLALLSGCATPHVVQAVKTSDSSLTCSQIETEMAESDRFRTDAQKEKGMTGTNVAAVIFFWPAMIGTYSNANEAIAAADARKANLMNFYTQKKCADQPLQTQAPAAASTESKLIELKNMLDKKLITQAEFDQKRQQVLVGL